LYCEFGLKSVSGFVNRLMAAALERYDPCANPIGMLQEYYQKKGLPLPEYREAGRIGPDHGPTFTVRVETGPGASCTGTGTKLVDAKEDAARTMVKKLGLLSAGNNKTGGE
jgi:ribonuclease-3